MRFNNLCSIDVGLNSVHMLAFVDDKPHFATFPVTYNFTREKLLKIINDFYLSFDMKFEGLAISVSGYISDSDMTVNYTTLSALNGLSKSDFKTLNCENFAIIRRSTAATLAGKIEYPNSKVLVGVILKPEIEFGVSIKNTIFTGNNGFAGGYYFDYTAIQGKILSSIINIINFYNPDVIYFIDNNINITNLFRYCNCHLPAFMTTNLKFAKTIYEDYACCFGAMQDLADRIKKVTR